MQSIKRQLANVLEVGLAVLFIYGGFNVIQGEPVVAENAFLGYLTGEVAILVYALLFFAQGASLAVAKVWRLHKLHGAALMSMYLVCLYVLILSSIINGFTTGLITTLIAGTVSAVLYLRWKVREIDNSRERQREVQRQYDDPHLQ